MKQALITTVAFATAAVVARGAITSGEVSRLTRAARVVRGIEQTISPDLWRAARCVAIVPDLKKAAFVVGGEYGRGVLSCRIGSTWSAPVFLQLAKGSWGFQVGAEQIDLILLVMNESGVQKLLTNKVTLGADASVAAGPVGSQGHVGTDAQLTAEIVSYSRAEGLFAGVDLSGGVLRPDVEANRDVYGAGASARTILASRGLSAPTAATDFLNALASHPAAEQASAGGPPAPERRDAEATGPSARTTAAGAELQARVADLRATLDRLIEGATPAPLSSGTPGATGTSGGVSANRVVVDRAQLLKSRDQLDAVVAALNARH